MARTPPSKAKPHGRSRPRTSRTVLHIDPFSGIAGNMFLGALLDAGLSRRALTEGLAGLGVDHRLVVKKVKRGALAAPYVDVKLPKAKLPHGAAQGHAHGHRHLGTILGLLDRAALKPSVRDRAHAVFRALGEAEARVHGIPIEKVHFHEVGAVDAIVDITGAALGLDLLGVERLSCGPIALGHGTVETDHGRLPLPAPATFELLRGAPTVPAHVAWETVTPTGAAILRTVVDEFSGFPAMTVEAIGHGAGNDRKGALPNVLRVILGREAGGGADRVVALEANLDDLQPEHFDHVMEELLRDGALDVSLQHVQTKKNRPGFLLRVLVPPEKRAPTAMRILALTGSLGVRAVECDRFVLPRAIRRVETEYGKIRVKFVTSPDGRLEVSAEYDDCKRAARQSGDSLAHVIRSVEQRAREFSEQAQGS